MKDRHEIEALKLHFETQPFGELALTPGFEQHKIELRTFQNEFEAKRKAKEAEDFARGAQAIGLGDRLAFARYFDENVLQVLVKFEERITALESGWTKEQEDLQAEAEEEVETF